VGRYGSSNGGSCRGMSSDRNSSGAGSMDGGTGVPFSTAVLLRLLRATFFRAGTLRATVLRPAAFFRAAVLRVADLRPVAFRAVVLRTADLRPAVLRAADLRRVVFLAPVLRGCPGLRLLGIAPSVVLFGSVCRLVAHRTTRV
jgi:hypothetical protein